MSFCAIKICRNYSRRLKTSKHVSYHRMPSDPVIRARWIDVIRESRGEATWNPAKTSVVCSDHFRSKDIHVTENGYQRLKKDRVPCKIYKGLDLVTAKANAREREMAKHHLLDILEPHQMFTVVDFRNRALKIIENLTEQGKMPVIVGGTNYYIESIVYKILVEDMDDNEALLWDKSRRKRDFDDFEQDEPKEAKKQAMSSEKVEDEAATTSDNTSSVGKDDNPKIDDKETMIISKEQLKKDVDNEKKFTNEEIHAKLKAIDPAMAERLHVNNRRKVLRSVVDY